MPLEKSKSILKKDVVKDGRPSNTTGLEAVATYIKDNSPKIVVISGAGVSAQVGFPDLRSHDVGLYHAPMVPGTYFCDVLSKDSFLDNPWPLYDLVKHLIKMKYEPTLSHHFIALLSMKGLLVRNYTLNMDELERFAYIPPDKTIKVYGTWWQYSCISCLRACSTKWFFWKTIRSRYPQCEKCTALIRPNILLYREPLPDLFFKHAPSDFKTCDLLIVLGTTLSHEPFSSYIRQYQVTCPRLVISDVEPYEFSDFDFYGDDGRDVLWLGSCDAGCKRLAKLLGWIKELGELAKVDLSEPTEDLTELDPSFIKVRKSTKRTKVTKKKK